ncbi:MAG: hypothetical protein AAFV62_10500 [Pseudomonadota bacterium]
MRITLGDLTLTLAAVAFAGVAWGLAFTTEVPAPPPDGETASLAAGDGFATGDSAASGFVEGTSASQMDQAARAETGDAALAEILGRPLFRPDRQPRRQIEIVREPLPPAAPPQLSPPPVLALRGVLISDSGTVALVNRGSNGALQVREGDVIEGWSVAAISSSALTLEQSDRRVTIELRRHGGNTGGRDLGGDLGAGSSPSDSPDGTAADNALRRAFDGLEPPVPD